MVEVKKGDKVILKGFTGIKLGVFEVQSVTKKTLTIVKRNGDELIFDKKTGKQVNTAEGKEKYASSVMEDDGSYVAPSTRGKAKKSTKKTAKSKKNEEIVEDDEEIVEDDEEEEETPKAKKATKSKKKPEPEPEEEDDEDDEDDWEEVEDDD